MATILVSSAAALASAASTAQPGDDVVISAGTYRASAGAGWTFSVSGTSGNRITYRAEAGARVTLKPAASDTPSFICRVSGDYVTLRDIEITEPDTAPSGLSNAALIVYGDGVRLVYMDVHDNPARQGLTLAAGAEDFDDYGSRYYRNGEYTPPSNAIHGAYLQSVTTTAGKRFTETMLFDNMAIGFHAFTTSDGHVLDKYALEGVAAWGNGLVFGGSAQPNLHIGTNAEHVSSMTVRRCFTHHDFDVQNGYNGRLGFNDDEPNTDGLVEDCVFAGGLYPMRLIGWDGMTYRRNRHVGMRMSSPANLYAAISVEDQADNTTIDNNEYWRRNDWTIANRRVGLVNTPYDTLAAWTAATGWDANSVAYEGKPTSNWVYVRPHVSPGNASRAHIIAYNWEESATVDVAAEDLAGYLYHGDSYSIASAYDQWTEIASGTYDARGITIAHDPSSPYSDFAVYIITRGQSMTTTPAAIRDSLVTAIQALSPQTHAAEAFRFAPRMHQYTDFREWAGANDSACFRKFDIVFGEENPAGAMDQDTWRVDATLQLVVSYPAHHAKYGRDNSGDMADTMHQDLVQLATAIGLYGRANYPASAIPKLPEAKEFEDGEGVRFAVLTMGVEYYLDTIP